MDELTDLQIAIVTAHSMRRFMKNYEAHERTAVIEKVMMRLHKFLKQRERSNFKDFVYATEFERVFWTNVTENYDKKTKIFAIDFVTKLYDYFPNQMSRYVDLSEKLMLQFGMAQNNTTVSDDICLEITKNDNDFISTYINLFEPYSGVKLRKSLLAGKKLTIKNNLIIEGKKIAEGFE